VIKATTQFGQSLLSSGHFASEDIKEKLVSLVSEKSAILKLWEERQAQFSQCIELQVFLREAEQADGWMGKQEVSYSLKFKNIYANFNYFILGLFGCRRVG